MKKSITYLKTRQNQKVPKEIQRSSMAAETQTHLPTFLYLYNINFNQLHIIPSSPISSILFFYQTQRPKMAAVKSLLSLALIALLFFSESLATSAADRGGASNSLTGMLRRNILHTPVHQIADNNVESSTELKMNAHIKAKGGRIRPIATGAGTGSRKSAANRSRVASFGFGFLLFFLGLFL